MWTCPKLPGYFKASALNLVIFGHDLPVARFLQRRLVWILLYVPKTLRETVYESVNSSWRPSCASISINEDLFGYYFTSQKRSDKPFMKPSTLRGGLFGYYFTSRKRSDKPFTKPSTLRGDLPVHRFPSTKTCLDTTLRPKNAPTNRLRNRQLFVETFLCIDFHQRRLVWILLYVPKTLRQTVYETVNSSWRLVWILLYVPKMLQQTVYESVNPSWRPSCGSISFNVDSFGYYFTSQKCSKKPFANLSTLCGGTSVCNFVFFELMLNSAQDLPVAQFPSV
ncbi:uncharacterized protein LACBIDRAFT_336239 [Laccaria bicolor S238N-H82]|uniref:Predicted protein n=1 Tax=Laccaria bicolor (strain S238N-H82 / ATCC MYA-4686) TaxID=486041 RepID=B0E4U3_LACBS|nr:uncharacterized protein LACBIDRAFT_336239 [Laccaria bicolor S238N-H82]EDQ98140.1 predicted protein [Laccaria bicolor S238N-H82]|eukprot:XP_001891210.1 predicted protein [Laccaria bicolor S238N-H82]